MLTSSLKVPPMLIHKHIVSSTGINVAYVIKRVNKSKNALFFLHGAGSNYTVYLPFITTFNAYNCIAIDYPYHGHSDAKQASFSEIIEMIEQILHIENITQITLIGNCLGASLAHLFYKTYPQYVQSLVLLTLFSKRYICFSSLFLPLSIGFYSMIKYTHTKRKQTFVNYQDHLKHSILYYLCLDLKATSLTYLLYVTKELFNYNLCLGDIKVPAHIILAKQDYFTRNKQIIKDIHNNSYITYSEVNTNHIALTQEPLQVVQLVQNYLSHRVNKQ